MTDSQKSWLAHWATVGLVTSHEISAAVRSKPNGLKRRRFSADTVNYLILRPLRSALRSCRDYGLQGGFCIVRLFVSGTESESLRRSVWHNTVGFSRERMGELEAGSLSQVYAEAVASSLISASHLRASMTELLLHVSLIDFCRRGETSSQ